MRKLVSSLGYTAEAFPLAADFSYQVLALNRLVLTIARIYGRSTTREQRAATVAIAWPVTKDASGETKNAATAAISWPAKRTLTRTPGSAESAGR